MRKKCTEKLTNANVVSLIKKRHKSMLPENFLLKITDTRNKK